MAFPTAMQKVLGLTAQMEALAALGAHFGHGKTPLAPRVDAATAAVVDVLGAPDFADLTATEAEIIQGFIRAFFRQAVDLLENPGRPAGWSFDDP